MRWVFSILMALTLLGCGNEQSILQKVQPPTTAKAATTSSSGTSIASTPNGAALFMQKCAACHGQHSEKQALGKSQVIAGWESTKIISALNGYKDGSYGGDMKALMQGQVKPLNDKQTEALATYISTL